MRFVEVMTTMEEGGVIRIPEAELKCMGLQGNFYWRLIEQMMKELT